MYDVADRKERLASLAGVALLHLLLGWALLVSFAPSIVRGVNESLGVFNVREAPPPPRFPEPEPEPERQVQPSAQTAPAPPEPQGKSAAPAPRRQAPPVAAPKRIVPTDVRPPVAAGIVPATGGDRSALTSSWAGAGARMLGGGSGSGSGSGNAGTGSGAGGTGGNGRGVAVTRAQLRSGRIVPADYPRAAGGEQGVVEARLTVSPTGAVTGCSITRSSGNGVLDAATCRLMRQRFRFAPARDAEGHPVADVRGWQQRWWRD